MDNEQTYLSLHEKWPTFIWYVKERLRSYNSGYSQDDAMEADDILADSFRVLYEKYVRDPSVEPERLEKILRGIMRHKCTVFIINKMDQRWYENSGGLAENDKPPSVVRRREYMREYRSRPGMKERMASYRKPATEEQRIKNRDRMRLKRQLQWTTQES